MHWIERTRDITIKPEGFNKGNQGGQIIREAMGLPVSNMRIGCKGYIYFSSATIEETGFFG